VENPVKNVGGQVYSNSDITISQSTELNDGSTYNGGSVAYSIVTQGQEKYLVILDIKFSGFYEGSDLPNENFLGWFLEHVIKTDGIAAVSGLVRKDNAFDRTLVPRVIYVFPNVDNDPSVALLRDMLVKHPLNYTTQIHGNTIFYVHM